MTNNQNINPADYTANQHPGKFEGEQPATEYFYEQMLAGDGESIFGNYAEDNSDEASLFKIDSDESDAFNLPIDHWFLLWSDNQGFVYGEVYETREQAETAFTGKI